MISSRQVVELIEDEIKIADPVIATELEKIVAKIETLEGIEMDKMYKDFVVHEEAERKRKEEIRNKAEEEFKRAFTGI
jgi:Asp-tRNA(Asn)/Glu-tRNA(Gln) amidotransferase C subunit